MMVSRGTPLLLRMMPSERLHRTLHSKTRGSQHHAVRTAILILAGTFKAMQCVQCVCMCVYDCVCWWMGGVGVCVFW